MTSEEEQAIVERRIAMEGRFVKMESQIDRLVSDAESEKGTRERVARDLKESFAGIKESFKAVDERLVKVEHKLYWASGIISAIIFASHLIFKG